MSIVYNKSHTITFTKDGVEKNSWTDFHMFPSFYKNVYIRFSKPHSILAL